MPACLVSPKTPVAALFQTDYDTPLDDPRRFPRIVMFLSSATPTLCRRALREAMTAALPRPEAS